jgi:hypothetical protein
MASAPGRAALNEIAETVITVPMESQLDWFHIGMRLELLRKAVVMPVTYQAPSEPTRITVAKPK